MKENKKYDPAKLECVLKLEVERREYGRKAGWLYHRCREEELLPELFYLESQGKISRWDPEEDRSYQIPIKGADRRKIIDSLIPGTPITFPKLELIPISARKQNIRTLTNKSAWRRLQSITFTRANFQCQVCGARPEKGRLHCHESWQYDDETWVQKIGSLVALCDECHEVVHIDLAADLGHGSRAYERLRLISKLPAPLIDEDLWERFLLQKRRSEHDWKIDISPIADIGILPSAEARTIGVWMEDGPIMGPRCRDGDPYEVSGPSPRLSRVNRVIVAILIGVAVGDRTDFPEIDDLLSRCYYLA